MTEVPASGSVPGVGDTIAGKYKITKLLGKGGMGVVYLARHEMLRQNVAIKMVLPEVAQDPVFVARFMNEARASAGIRNEHVAQVLDVAMFDNGAPYMVLEYLDGKDLSDVLPEAEGNLPIETAVDWILEALEAVAQAHALGIVHRDLKPSNLFLAKRQDGSSVIKVLDFGISKATNPADIKEDAAVTSTQTLLGSPAYMSPEQIRSSKHVDARADIWSMGVILYKLLTKAEPFVGDNFGALFAAIFSDEVLRVRQHRPEVPEALDDVVFRCLARERERRYQNVGELARALAPFASAEGRSSIERVRRTLAAAGVTSGDAPPPAALSPAAVTAIEGGKGRAADVTPAPDSSAAAAVSAKVETVMNTAVSAGQAPPKGKSRTPLIAVAVVVIGGAAIGGIMMGLREKQIAPTTGSGLVAPPSSAASEVPPPPSVEPPATTAVATATATASASAVPEVKPVAPVVPRIVKPVAVVKPAASATASAKPKVPDDSVLGGSRN
jgi:serine/threonine-protein kinase